MAQIETEDGKELVVVLGPAMEGDKAERRVRFMDGVEDDWEESEFMDPPWQTGTKIDVDTEDGLEQGATILGLPESGIAAELRIDLPMGPSTIGTLRISLPIS